ncbi:hypothetical protein F5884DRAFT_899578 [Xylogone sp. PMI_703]|nr:hypothetical protein F5884DRAFT_899578 [Xylogone sp. PMI_703]
MTQNAIRDVSFQKHTPPQVKGHHSDTLDSRPLLEHGTYSSDMLSARSYPLPQISTEPLKESERRLLELLSATSYPVPELYSVNAEHSHHHSHRYAGLAVQEEEDITHASQPSESNDTPETEHSEPYILILSHRQKARPPETIDNCLLDSSSTQQRRMQGRIAQRKYRERKLQAIVDCGERIRRLEEVIDEITTLFLALNDQLMTDLCRCPESPVLQHLQQTLEKFVSLARIAED